MLDFQPIFLSMDQGINEGMLYVRKDRFSISILIQTEDQKESSIQATVSPVGLTDTIPDTQ